MAGGQRHDRHASRHARAEAVASHGHDGARYTSNGACVHCVAEYTNSPERRLYKQKPEVKAADRLRKQSPEVRAADRIYSRKHNADPVVKSQRRAQRVARE